MKKWISISLALFFLLSALAGCESTGTTTQDDAASGSLETSSLTQADAEMFTDRDYNTEYDESSSIRIQLNGSSATASSDSVQISGTTVTITEEATYILSGTLDDGMIIVDAPDTAKLQLVLDGVNINSQTSAPLYILEADKVVVTLADGSENTLSNGGSFVAIDEENIDAALYSKQEPDPQRFRLSYCNLSCRARDCV